MGDSERPQISIVISTWNSRKQIEKCLASLPLFHPLLEVIVVDQGSRDGTLEYLRVVSGIRLAWFERRTTWAEANQLGVELARGGWVALSNPDIYFTEGAFDSLLGKLKLYGGFKIFGCHLISSDGGDVHPLARLSTAFIFFVSSHRTIGTWIDRKILHRFFEKHFITPKHQDSIVGHINASFMVFPRGMTLWNRRFRWAVADSDMIRRADQNGVLQIYLHDVRLIHEGEHSKKTSSKPLYEYEYAYGYSLYAKIWKLYGLRLLFSLDAIFAPLLLVAAGEDTLKNQIRCSAAKISGLIL